MRLPRALLAVAVPLVLAAAVEAAPKAGKKNHPVHGVVVAVQKDKDADSGTITVRIHHKTKKAAAAGLAGQAQERTFKVTNATQFQRVGGKKGQQQNSPTTFRHVHKGEHVTILHQGQTAQDVRIHAKGKGKGIKTVRQQL